MLDFPNAPTLGQKYPQPAVSGVPVYTWDGQKWTTAGSDVGTVGNVRYDIIQSLTTPQKVQARTNIGINQAVALAALQDFNLVTAPGTYCTIDQSSLNVPSGSHFYLLVELHTDPTFIKQTATQRGSQAALTYIRTLGSGIWSAWHQVMFADNNLSELTNIVLARQTVYAAPFDSMAYNGMQVNGGFEVRSLARWTASLYQPPSPTLWMAGRWGQIQPVAG